ncbi:MAG: DUF929 domain-containing protein [Thermoplasmata archaeon]|nr:DUF929 domain-containing protein [Thermoplasmata archaeon]
MADWDRVERLRSKGWDWDKIAGDERVDFHAEEGAGDPGRALRALYYQRRSRAQRRPSGGGKSGSGDDMADPTRPKWTFARIGFILTPLVGVWALLAYIFPSPIGVYVSAIPVLAVALFASAAVLTFGLLRTADRWNPTMRNTVAIGCVLGLVIAGGFGLAAISQGCPSLTSSTQSEPDSFLKANNGAWQENGAPVFFFYGASGCPYCSASSWSMWYALKAFGTVSGVQYGSSSPTDSFPNTPEIIISYLSVQSKYVSLVSAENLDGVAVGPTPSSCIQQAYVSAYDTSGIPFIVLNGQYYHQGTLVDPGQLSGLNATQIMGQIQAQSGVAWNAISPAAYWMMAYLVKLNGGAPSNVASISQVQSDLSQIS